MPRTIRKDRCKPGFTETERWMIAQAIKAGRLTRIGPPPPSDPDKLAAEFAAREPSTDGLPVVKPVSEDVISEIVSMADDYSIPEIAQHLETSVPTVNRTLAEHRPNKPACVTDEMREQILGLFGKAAPVLIAERFGLSAAAVNRIYRSVGHRRQGKRPPAPPKPAETAEQAAARAARWAEQKRAAAERERAKAEVMAAKAARQATLARERAEKAQARENEKAARKAAREAAWAASKERTRLAFNARRREERAKARAVRNEMKAALKAERAAAHKAAVAARREANKFGHTRKLQDRIVEMRREGHRVSAIAKAVGLGATSVYTALKRAGLSEVVIASREEREADGLTGRAAQMGREERATILRLRGTMSNPAIAKMLGRPAATIWRYCRGVDRALVSVRSRTPRGSPLEGRGR